jgi:Protein of unknown function (DUF4031)
MAILLDTPRVYAGADDKRAPRCFRGKLSCHMASDLLGAAGTAELLAFAKRIKLKAEWIQYPGTAREHFDLVGTRITAAVLAGAVVDDARSQAAFHAKAALARRRAGTTASVGLR